MSFVLSSSPLSCIVALQRDIHYFQQNEGEPIGMALVRFSCLVKPGLVLSILKSLLLRNFYEGLDKDSAYYLDALAGGSFLHKSPAEGTKFLDSIIEYTTFTVKRRPLREQRKSCHEDRLAVEFDPSPSTSSDLAIAPSPEPGTPEGEEIRSLKFPSQFEDDPSRNHRNTLNFFDAQSGDEPSSVHTDQSRNPLTEPIPMCEPIEQGMVVSPLDTPKSVLEKYVEHFKGDDLGEALHLLTEQPSSHLTKLKSLPTGP
jgi:hypothetical protein